MKFFIFSILTATSLLLAFMPFNFTYLIYVGIIPFILLNEKLQPKKAFLYSLIVGLFFYGVRFYWMMSVLYEFNGFKLFYVYLLVVLLTATFMGVYGFIISILRDKKYKFFYIAFALVLIEFVRGNFPIISFTWGRFSDVLYNQPITLKLASIGGEWFLLYFIVFINYLILSLYKKKKVIYIVLIIAILFSVYGLNQIPPNSTMNNKGKIKIAIIQPNINPWKKYQTDTSGEIYSMIRKSISNKANYVILPEASFIYKNLKDDYKIIEYSKSATIIVGDAYYKNGNFYNSDFVVRNGNFQEYRKHHLVPYVEYVPFRNLFGKVAGVPSGDTIPGTSIKVFGNKIKFGIEICFESIFEKISKEYALKGANFIAVSTNDGWFKDTFAVEEHFRKLNIIAAETGVNFIQSANTGISGFVDHNGITIVKSKKNKKEILYIQHNLESKITIYDLIGDYWILILLAPILLLEIIKMLKRSDL